MIKLLLDLRGADGMHQRQDTPPRKLNKLFIYKSLVTPSLISDFFLFALPGPAALGFALMFPAVLFGSGHRLEVLAMISVLYVLPLIAGTAVIYYVWRMMRWRSLSRRRAPHDAKDNRPSAPPAND